MKLVKFDAQTMSLKEITDLLGVRHDNAMRVVADMVANSAEFGAAPQIEEQYKKGGGAKGKLITYSLNKRQSIAVASRLNTDLLMRIIDRWQELEEALHTKQLTAITRKTLGDEYLPMSIALHESREALGKETKHFHYSNEADMINRVLLGCTAKEYKERHNTASVRDSLTPIETDAMLSLQRANAAMLDMGESFCDRKEKLEALYRDKWCAKLVAEHVLLEA